MSFSYIEKLLILLSVSFLIAYGQPCQSFQYLNQENCVACPQGCLSCSNSASCLTCKTGSYLANNMCLKCSAKNCESCPNNVCSSCQISYNLINRECSVKYSQKTSQLIILLVSMLTVFIIGCVSLCLISHYCCKKKINQTNHGVRNMNSIEVLEKPKASEVAIENFNWKKIQDGNKIVNQDDCSICLDHRSNVELQCKHFFHLNCIGTWLENRDECPICKMKVFNEGSLYCRKCLKFYLNVNLRGLSGIKQCKLICASCEFEEFNAKGNMSENIMKVDEGRIENN